MFTAAAKMLSGMARAITSTRSPASRPSTRVNWSDTSGMFSDSALTDSPPPGLITLTSTRPVTTAIRPVAT